MPVKTRVDSIANFTFPRLTFAGNPQKPLVDTIVRPVFEDGESAAAKDTSTWRISWTTMSYANITEYRLLYRKVPVS